MTFEINMRPQFQFADELLLNWKEDPVGGAKIRTSHSRNGCARCKKRKIKCDETKPQCLRCMNTRKGSRVCPGYSQPLRFVNQPNWPKKASLHTSEKISEHKATEAGLRLNDSLPKATEVAQTPILENIDLGFQIWGSDCETKGNEVEIVPSLEAFSASESLQWKIGDDFEVDQGSRPTEKPESITCWSPRSSHAIEEHDIRTPVAELAKLPLQYSTDVGESLTNLGNSIVQQPCHVPTMLVDYWFKRVCPAVSAFDSPSNPLRYRVSDLWRGSSSIYHALLSMSSACLDEKIPHLSSTGFATHARNLAMEALRDDLKDVKDLTSFKSLENSVMACQLLGYSSSWISGRDLGQFFFNTARKLLANTSLEVTSTSEDDQYLYQFYQEGMLYWDMLLCAGGEKATIRASTCMEEGVDSTLLTRRGRVFPHPFTGTAGPAQRLLAAVLSINHEQRELHRMSNFLYSADLRQGLENIRIAGGLEQQILEMKARPVDEIEDTGDEVTPTLHLTYLTQVHLDVALLQLYRSFPELLLSEEKLVETDVDKCLTKMALTIVGNLREVPPASGVRCMLPVLYMMAASELKFELPPTSCKVQDFRSWNLSPQDWDVARARSSVLDCLSFYGRCLPSRPVERATEIVKGVWNDIDDGLNSTWMDVMRKNDLVAIFC